MSSWMVSHDFEHDYVSESGTCLQNRSCDQKEALVTHYVGPKVHLPSSPTYVVLDTGRTRSMRNRSALQKLEAIAPQHGNDIKDFPCETRFKFADSGTSSVSESCVLTFPTFPPCRTQVDILETGDVPILLSLPQMKDSGMSLELHADGDLLTRPAFNMYRATP